MLKQRGSKTINYTKSKIIILCYMLVISYLHIYGCCVHLHENVHVPALLVFGDSIVDTGNNNYLHTIAKGNFPPYGRDFIGGVPTGRFSNGKVPSDFIAEALGVKEYVPPYLDPTLKMSDLLTGVSFASSASGYDPTSGELLGVLTLEDQLNHFKEYINKLRSSVGENLTQTIISQSAYIVCSGSNDLTNTYFFTPFKNLMYNTSSYTSLLVNSASIFIQELYNLGARRIGVVSMPPIGCVPSQRTLIGGLSRECVDKEKEIAILFNNKLYSKLGSLKQKLFQSRIVYLDAYTSLLNLITDPSPYGFEIVDRGCCGTGYIEASIFCTKFDPRTCKDATKYVFWDSFHPTENAYKFIVQQIMPEIMKEFF